MPTDRSAWRRAFLLGLALTAGVAGCANRELQRRYARRGENMRATLDMLGELEDRRPESMRATVEILQDIHRDDVESHRRNREQAVPGWSRAEVTRWEDRRPAIREGAAEVFGGQPDNIGRTLPLVLD